MSAPKDEQPFHMQDNGGNTSDIDEPILIPNDIDAKETPEMLGIKRVDIGSMKAQPGIDYSTYKAIGKGLVSSARLTDDGRIVISLDLKKPLPDLPEGHANPVKEYAVDRKTYTHAPAMNIVIMIVGSRGDVQPFIVLGHALQKHGHRIRIATHETFRQMVKEAGLEFFCIGGDPADLMSYMVKNPGLLPGMSSLLNGDIQRKRAMVAEMLDGCWKACYEADDESGEVFAADAIISNPPAFAHIHCAEALGIPLHLSFTMPWCATTTFPHPLVNIKASNAHKGLTNYLSYAVADLLQWQGLGDIINRFRSKTLGLGPLTLRSGPGVTDRLKIPWTYCFSPSLIPQPKDWVNHIDIVGFYFLEAATDYKPPEDLVRFLDDGEPPIYIGFGSVVVEDAETMTQTIFDAIKQSNVRAIVSAGWGGLGGSAVPPNVHILPEKPGVPHDWLFTKVFAVCHPHVSTYVRVFSADGGAGTTAIGLYLGKPTIIVPFFGDQPFWGYMVYKAGAGPEPIPQKKLSVEFLAAGIKYCSTASAKAAASEMGEQIRAENALKQDGAKAGVDSFHAHLPLLNMRCDLDPTRVAVWWSTEHCLKLSAFAAQILVDSQQLLMEKLQPHRTKEYDTSKKSTDPITADRRDVGDFLDDHELLYWDPAKGVIDTATAIPRGIIDIVGSVQEGFQNAPKLYGSTVRSPGPVTDFKSGVKEAAKGFFYGYYDGITGLVTEPVKGAQKEGFIGAIKGSGRSFVNVTMRPAAGALGIVTHPAKGLWKSMQNAWAKQEQSQTRSTRETAGREAVTREEIVNAKDFQSSRSRIIQAFEQSKPKVKERRALLKKEVENFWNGGGGLNFENADGTPVNSSQEPTSLKSLISPDRANSRRPSPPRHPSQTRRDAKMAEPDARTSQASAAAADVDVDAEYNAAFKRDMTLAKEASLIEYRVKDGDQGLEKQVRLAEQRGYEKALADLQAKIAEQKLVDGE
ncbi:hypothetical protein FRB96_003194 [Tulasnella sp. 330]|nr:hypothetical protein FRB96_003194 [Tulasnella sp. 330]